LYTVKHVHQTNQHVKCVTAFCYICVAKLVVKDRQWSVIVANSGYKVQIASDAAWYIIPVWNVIPILRVDGGLGGVEFTALPKGVLHLAPTRSINPLQFTRFWRK